MIDQEVDEFRFVSMLKSLDQSSVDSVAVLGSTGSYMYLTDAQREAVVTTSAEAVQKKPLIVGVGDISTTKVLKHIDVAERVGAKGILVAPVSYQPLTSEEVFHHFQAISEYTEIPVIVYDNPGVTHFEFDIELYSRISYLPGVVSIKIPPTAVAGKTPEEMIKRIRESISEDVSIGISGDGSAVRGLRAGCDIWYSAIAGTFPLVAEEIMTHVRAGEFDDAERASARFQPVWDLFSACGGSLRAIAALAYELGLADRECLPQPLRPLHCSLSGEVMDCVRILKRAI